VSIQASGTWGFTSRSKKDLDAHLSFGSGREAGAHVQFPGRTASGMEECPAMFAVEIEDDAKECWGVLGNPSP
jgi:hypothetical protein